MGYNKHEEYAQDSAGDVNRKIDNIRGQSGDLVEIVTEDVGVETVVMEIPEDVREAYLNKVFAHNSSAEDGTLRLYDVELDEGGDITTSTVRTVPIPVAIDNTETVDFVGEPFTGDAIAVNSGFEGSVSVGVYLDSREEDEPTVEQRNSLE